MGMHGKTITGAVSLLASVAIVAALLVSPVAMAADDGVDADDVVAALARAGYPADLGEDLFGDPEIESAIGNTLFDVFFFECDGTVCETMTFSTIYATDNVSIDETNAWNINNLHGQAYLDDDDEPNLDLTILAAGGLTEANLRAIVRQWAISLAEFEDHIGWTANSGGAAAASDGAAVASTASTIEVCNNSGDGVSIAYATEAGGTDSSGDTLFLSEGWLNIGDRDCTDVWESPFENRFYYIYAEADDGHYDGDFFFCTLKDAFEIVDTQCTADFERNGFLQIDMSEGNRMQIGHIVNLDP
tara:strand:+ start:85824 stop:86729 length:906 start_codon:yes stop_codon:yes gene_type:complete